MWSEWLTPEDIGPSLELQPIPEVPEGTRVYVVTDDLDFTRYRWAVFPSWEPSDTDGQLMMAENPDAAIMWFRLHDADLGAGGTLTLPKPVRSFW
jgi:hypothetical protein